MKNVLIFMWLMILGHSGNCQEWQRMSEGPLSSESRYIAVHERQIASNTNNKFPPPNDACTSAISLTIDGGCVNGTTETATIEASEPDGGCITSGMGCTADQSVWYTFNSGANTQLWLDLTTTNSFNCVGGLAVYPGDATSCLPLSGTSIVCDNAFVVSDGGVADIGDLRLSLTINTDYLIQIFGRDGGGPGDGFLEFCLELQTYSATCNVCAITCGTACGFDQLAQPTVLEVLAACTATDIIPPLRSGETITRCYDFTAITATTVSFQMILNTIGCGIGNVTNFSYTLYNSDCSVNTIGNLSNMSWNLPAGSFVFCFTYEALCVHEAQTPYFWGDFTVILPLSLTSFEGFAEPNQNRLICTVNSTTQPTQLMLERRPEQNELWSLLEMYNIENPNDTLFTYTVIDENPRSLLTYYRLREIYENGNSEVKRVIAVSRLETQNETLRLFPQPARNFIYWDQNITSKGNWKIEIYNIVGDLITSKSHIKNGKMNVERLLAGIYLVQFSSENGQTHFFKMIKEE